MAIVIGIDLGGTNIRAGRVDEKGKILKRAAIPTETGKGSKAVMENIIRAAKEVAAPDVQAAAVVSPGIINPVTGEVLPPGSEGELVFTMITKQALPLIRYRTRDITSLNYDKCACGRTIVRMDRVSHRSDDMLIVRGVNLFPSQIESLLLDIEGTSPHYLIVLSRSGAMDDLEVRVEVSPELFSDEIKGLERLRNLIGHKIKDLYGLSAKVSLVEPGSIERSVGKAKRVLDLRK